MLNSRIRAVRRGLAGNLRQTGVLVLGLLAAAGSAGSSRNVETPNRPEATPEAPPAAKPMDARLAVGLWKTNFGPVKMQFDDKQPGNIIGVWVYDRQGAEVIGFFNGAMGGNVLNFNWQEPADPRPLRGAGYLEFDPNGRTFSGKWWSDDRSRGGEWNGWRTEDTAPGAEGSAPAGLSDGVPRGEGPAEQAPPPPPAQPPAGGYL